MSSLEELPVDPYEALGLPRDATEKDIKTAYRKKSLKVHPDRNPDNPQAAHEFHLLSLAQELLLDGPKRAALDIKNEHEARRKEKMAGLESRKRGMMQDLLAKEEAAKKMKMDSAAQARQSANEQSVQAEGRRLREERAAQAQAAADLKAEEEKKARTREKKLKEEVPEIERTLKLTLPKTLFETSTQLEAFISSMYGDVSHSVLAPAKKLKSKVTAIVVFPPGNLSGCWALWEDCRLGRKEVVDIKCKWAGGENTEPEWVSLLSKSNTFPGPTHQQQSSEPQLSQPPSFPAPIFSSFTTSTAPPAPGLTGLEYENATLLKMRQAERERLEREIREAEGDD